MAWLNAGAQAQEHKYYKRIDLPPTKGKKNNYRYFYSKSAYDDYLQKTNQTRFSAKQLLNNALNAVKNRALSTVQASDVVERFLNFARSKSVAEIATSVGRDPDINNRFTPYVARRDKDPDADKYDNVSTDEQAKADTLRSAGWKQACTWYGFDEKKIDDQTIDRLKKNKEMFSNETWSDFAHRSGLIDPETESSKPKSFSDLKRTNGNISDDIDQQAVNSDNLFRAREYGEKIYDKNKDGFPDGARSIGYSQNCAYCSLAYEMRQRGYDVEAAAVSTSTVNSVEVVESWYSGGKFTTVQKKKPTADRIQSDILASSPNGSRGSLAIQWTAGGGHMVTYEVIDNKVIVRDCQTNLRYNLVDYPYIKQCSVAGFMRTDNLALTDDALVGVRNK